MKTIDNAAFARCIGIAARHADPAIVERIGSFLREARESEVASLNPRGFARQAGTDETATSEAFLRLAQAGLFRLSWTLLCPRCRNGAARGQRLATLRGRLHCPVCGQDFDAFPERDAELRVEPAPEVVSLGSPDAFEIHLSGFDLGPGVSLVVPSGGRRTFSHGLEKGNYLIVNREGRSILDLVVDGEAASGWQAAGYRFVEGRQGTVVSALKEGPARLVLENAGSVQRELVFARLREDTRTGTAYVSGLRAYREAFAG